MVSEPVLIVDDEVEMRIAMSETLKHCGYPVEISHNAIDAIKKFKQNNYSLVITDMTMPKRSGLELLKDIKSIAPAKPVIMATAYGTVETAVEAMKHGAFDYIRKPIDFGSFQFIVQQALNYRETSSNLANPVEKNKSKLKPEIISKEIITQNQKMMNLLKVAEDVAKSKSTVMIQSESGTGKELMAHHIHQKSNRLNEPFVAVNCAAIPENLLESELFGYEKGAFTGAISRRIGKFEEANGGTLLLDEISEMDLRLQAKLLRAIQEKEIDRIGGKQPIKVDARIIATSNREMEEEVKTSEKIERDNEKEKDKSSTPATSVGLFVGQADTTYGFAIKGANCRFGLAGVTQECKSNMERPGSEHNNLAMKASYKPVESAMRNEQPLQ